MQKPQSANNTSPLAETLATRFRVAAELHVAGVAMQRQTLRRRHPTFSEAEIERTLKAWLADRPGARDGDSAGPVRRRHCE